MEAETDKRQYRQSVQSRDPVLQGHMKPVLGWSRSIAGGSQEDSRFGRNTYPREPIHNSQDRITGEGIPGNGGSGNRKTGQSEALLILEIEIKDTDEIE